MRRDELILMTAFLLLLEGYLIPSAAPALAGLFLVLYVASVRFSTRLAVEAERDVPEREVEEGKELEVIVRVRNLGTDCIVRIKDGGGAFSPVTMLVQLREGEEREVRYAVIPKRWGRFKLSPASLILEDVRGLYFEEVSVGKGEEVKVIPSLGALREAARVEANLRLLEKYRRSFHGGEIPEIKELREFQPGDDIRRVDWKATARLGEIIIRELERESEADVYIVVDNTREMRKGVRMAKVDYASILALQLAYKLGERFKVGLAIYDERKAKVLPPDKGLLQVERMRRFLESRWERGIMSLRFSFSFFGDRGREFLAKVFPFVKGRKGVKGIYEAFSLIKRPSVVLLITDLSNPLDVYRAVKQAVKVHRVIILSPNPVLFYAGSLDEGTLERLYRAYLEREEIIRRFLAIAPTIDLGPSDYLREIAGVAK
ncbi:DUF58 domain-containing protein [Pyrococcus yayanosii]|uniref:DUF58 domain-containing protein n=1 Tax=Pyrococcus yayanosii (strain CH1 / JCM 16557) TaxID=529709 RepID=F8AHZ4_PYRYC|nr:DUF58 domain-containing protein [Pyrococcus yayanosii]AEH25451.1 hypothetical protein PYCH_17940 [Pyrococcus yayanosii CH1]